MVLAMQFSSNGGPDVLKRVEAPVQQPKPGEVRVRHTAIGVNFIDIYHRNGLYKTQLPTIPGLEAAGVVEAVGEGVTLPIGTRVAYARGPVGAYAEERIIDARHCVVVPDGVSDVVAASALLKGLTAWALLCQAFPVRKGDTILVHAAAGGVGQILCQWAKHLGCRIIGTVGSEAKGITAKQAGADEIILYREEDVAKRVRELTNGKGVPVVYDAVGKDTFMASLDSLEPRGMLVSYGQASGPIPPFEISELAKRGSLFLTRPSLTDYTKDDGEYQRAAKELFRLIENKTLKLQVQLRYALTDAAAAHTAIEARETSGSTVLIP